MPFQRYNATWHEDEKDPDGNLRVEMACIRKGGRWKIGDRLCGEGLSFHYERMRQILWPYLDDHRWNSLCRDTILSNKVTVLLGCASSGKTHSAAWIFLCEYFCFPEETCVLVSSTDMGGLRLRVWGEINKLWSEAVNKFPELPGHLIDSRLLIATDDLSENDMDEVRVTRDWRKGIKGVATVQGAKYVGLGKYVGIKQKRMRLIADEAQFMPHTFLSAMANLDKNEDFKAIVLGNPLDPTDALGKAAEPVDGWAGHMEPKKTEVWNTKNGKCVNLVGTDSPNFDFPDDQPTRYKYLISREKIAFTLMTCPKDSIEYYSQCMGVMKIGVLSRRILTRDMCRQFGAMSDVVWKGAPRTRILALDAAYGGDRCITGFVDFGTDISGGVVVKVGEPVEIPIIVREDQTPEDQISHFLKNYALTHDIKPENFFYDSTGRGSLGTSLARIWSNLCNPIEFGGRPTPRPVSLDHYTEDEETKLRRLKRCDEHYDRFVSELAFSVRYVVEGSQMRTLPTEVMEEFCDRKWDMVKGNKISIEPKSGTATKPGFKQRIGRSCDLADWLAIGIEGARQRGFEIKKLGAVHVEENDDDFFAEESKRWNEAIKGNLLQHT